MSIHNMLCALKSRYIGLITKTAEENGFTINLLPPCYTNESLAKSIFRHLSSH